MTLFGVDVPLNFDITHSLTVISSRAKFVECPFQKPNWYLHKMSWFCKKTIIHYSLLFIIFALILLIQLKILTGL